MSRMDNHLVVTVIPNWNLIEDLGECLLSLQKATFQNLQVVVVDNGSSDGSPQYILDHFPECHLIALKQNLGYAGALNAGIEYALAQKAKYVLVLNNDTIVEPGAVETLVRAMESDPGVGIAAPKILYYHHPNIIYSLGDLKKPWLPVPLSIGRKKRDTQQYTGMMEFDYVTGCAMLIRAELFQEIGLFDPSYFMYYEDSDFCRRARDSSSKIVCVGDAKVFHKASLSSNKERPLITQIRARNRVRFYRKYRHGPHPALTYLVIFLMAFWRSAEYALRGEVKLVQPYLSGLIQGMQETIPPEIPLKDSPAAQEERAKPIS